MSEVTDGIRGTLASRREAEERPPGSVAPSMIFRTTFSVCPNHRLLVVKGGRERLIGGEDRPMHDLGDKPAAATLFVGSNTEPNHGRLRLRHERMDIRLVVNNAIETLQPHIKERNHHLCVALPDAPVWLHADPWRLEQVFVNLLANALKYTDAGGELAVWMHTRDGQAVVSIRDSGIGIAPEALPHIFDLFKQADEAADRSRSGLGIGLALVRNLVEAHGGSVIAASAGPGKGSEFTVRLPCSDEATLAANRIPC